MPRNAVTLDVLKEWLRVIQDAIWLIRVDQHIFRAVFPLIEKSPELQKRESHFYLWIYDN